MSQIASISHPTMQLSQRIRTMVLAAAAALAIASIPAAQAHAATSQPTLCAATDPATGYIQFYLPGETITDTHGNKWTCSFTGGWIQDPSSTLQTPPAASTSTLRVPLSTTSSLAR